MAEPSISFRFLASQLQTFVCSDGKSADGAKIDGLGDANQGCPACCHRRDSSAPETPFPNTKRCFSKHPRQMMS